MTGARSGRRRRTTAVAAASSFHLWWRMPSSPPLVEVEATCEVLVPPQTDRLHFWALQVGFSDGRRSYGGAHTGLQWHRREPTGRAVNWGGYHDPVDGGSELDGSRPALAALNPSGNTMRYDWEPGTPYRFRVFRAADAWRAEVEDLDRRQTTVIRDLYAGGHLLADPVVWSEIFAPCDDPSVTVRWSGLEGRTAQGTAVRPDRVTVTYQEERAGGCPNTTVASDDVGLLQTTNSRRAVGPGAELAVPLPGGPAAGRR